MVDSVDSQVIDAVRRILHRQIVVLACVVLVGWVVFDWYVARSILLGGAIAWIPNAYLAIKISRSSGKKPQQIVRGFYIGETVKFILTMALFVMVFQMPNILFLPLMIGFAAVLSVHWFALLLEKSYKF